MIVFYSYRFRLMPTIAQCVLIDNHFGVTRYVFNYFLAQRREKYKVVNKSSSFYDDCISLVKLKKSLPWMMEVNAQSLQYAIKRLDVAYKNFFAGRGRFPKFKSKHNDVQSFRVPQHTKVDDDRIYIPKFRDGIKFIKHRKIDGQIKFCTISKNKVGQYHVSITVKRDTQVLPQIDKEVGIDLGIKTLVTCSDGNVYNNRKSYRDMVSKLRVVQRRHSKKQKGSKNRERARRKLAKIHQRIKNIRTDHLHKTTTKIVNENQVIYLETLAVRNMMKNHCLAGAIADASWCELNRQLEYKAKWYGRSIVRLDRWFPSSKTHDGCGWINQGLRLKDRTWVCGGCGEKVDRDQNAAKMILKQGKIQNKLPLERREVKRMDSGKIPTELSVG